MRAEPGREVLPIPDRRYVSPPMYEVTHEDVDYEPIKPVRPPAGAPNILVVLLDDAGFGSSSTFGGPCRTPTVDQLAPRDGRDRRRARRCEGVIVSQGGLVGGWTLYAKDGRPKYCYNFYGIDLFHVEGTTEIGEGRHLVRMQFDYDGDGVAKGGRVRLFIDDKPAGEGRVERTQPMPFASDEPFDIGRDLGSAVTPDYSTHEFTGDVNWVEIEIPSEGPDHDYEIPVDERVQAALTVE